jgi:hypothetical protein
MVGVITAGFLEEARSVSHFRKQRSMGRRMGHLRARMTHAKVQGQYCQNVQPWRGFGDTLSKAP